MYNLDKQANRFSGGRKDWQELAGMEGKISEKGEKVGKIGENGGKMQKNGEKRRRGIANVKSEC